MIILLKNVTKILIISFIAPVPPKGDKPEKETFMIAIKMLLQKTTKVIDNQSN